MQLGMIGLGRMGANIVRRLMRAGHHCVVFDQNPAPGKALAAEGAVAASSLQDLVGKLDAPRHHGEIAHATALQTSELDVSFE